MRKDDEDITFLEKYDAAKDYAKREPIWLHPQEMDQFVDWAAQKEDTLAAAIKYPFRYMPMYHYEPRRWSALDNTNQPETERYDPVEECEIPFNDIATPDRAGTFVGFKIYTALGYKPLDPLLKQTLTTFYGRCEAEGIPIMCHCSPSGMYSHDRELYFMREYGTHRLKYLKDDTYDQEKGFYDEFVRPSAWRNQVMSGHPELKLCLAHFGGGSSDWDLWRKDTQHKRITLNIYKFDQNAENDSAITPEENDVLIASWYNRFEPRNKRFYKGNQPLPQWYFDCFGAAEEEALKEERKGNPKPQTWIKEMVEMLEEYENFYTDISFHFLENHKNQLTWLLKNHPDIHDKIMFGSDWYMTELDHWSLEKFVERVKDALDDVSHDLEKETGLRDDLFLRFSRLNPMKFYRVRSIADKFAEGLRKAAKILNNKRKVKFEKSNFGDAAKNKETISLDDIELNNNLKIINQSDLY